MLSALTIRNLAVVDSIDLELGTGLTALTGETGAGKSILVDAIGLVLGDRTDNGMIRSGCARAEITATFRIGGQAAVQAWLDEHAIAHDGECLLRRVLVRDGRSRAFVNGSPVTIADLGTIGEHLLDIHGQHAHQSLTRRAYQRELLDAYGGHQALAAEVGDVSRKLRGLRRRVDELRAAADERASRLDLLRFQVDELGALGLQPGEWEALEAEHRRLSHAGEVRERSERLLALLYDEGGTESGLRHATDLLGELADIDPSLQDSLQMVQSALIEIQEVAPALRHYAEAVELDPERLQALDERIGAIHALARKYRVRADELPDRLAAVHRELAGLDGLDDEIAQLAAAEAAALAEYRELATRLRARRRTAGKRLAREITASMQTLQMQGGSFSVQLAPLDAAEAGATGTEQPEFLVTANPGLPEQPLAEVASGGELSRISLAVQVAAAECSTIPTLIFDEVDAGIGGGVAEIVGRLLRRIGATRQVLCVTHLPQVAAQAHQQLRVTKTRHSGETRTLIETLDPGARVEELARMLGGVRITRQTRAHAEEMLALAAEAPATSGTGS